jgi:hypothetical protein
MINRHVYFVAVNAASRINCALKRNLAIGKTQNTLFHSTATLLSPHRNTQEAKVIYCASFVPRPVIRVGGFLVLDSTVPFLLCYLGLGVGEMWNFLFRHVSS